MSTYRDSRSRSPSPQRPSNIASGYRPAQPILNQRQHAWLTLVYLAFVIYGSLLPFQYTPLSWEESMAKLREGFDHFEMGSRTDAVTNVLLFVPLSYLAMGFLCVDRPWLSTLSRLPVVFVFCLISSFSAEFLQIWFPPRTPDLRDVLAMLVGTLGGSVAWIVGGQRWTDWCRAAWNAQTGTGLASRLLPLYFVALFFVHVLPLDLTIHPVEVWHKYKEGRVILVPFSATFADDYEAAEKYIWTFLYFAPLGLLLAGLDQAKWARWSSAPRIAIAGFLASGLMEFFQLWVNSRVADTTDVLVGGICVLIGWASAMVYRAWQTQKVMYARTVGYVQPARFTPTLPGALVLAWLALTVFVTWHPFDFKFDRELISERTSKISWMPLAGYYGQDYLHSIEEFLRKIILYAIGGGLVALALPMRLRLWTISIALTACAIIAVVLELGQLYLATRYFSLDDILIETFGAWIGSTLGKRAQTAGKESGPRRRF